LSSLTIRVYGNYKKPTSGLGSVRNIALTTDGVMVGSIMQLGNCTSTICYVTFSNINTIIPKNSLRFFNVIADIADDSSVTLGDQFWMGLNAETDLSLTGAQSGKLINAEGGELNKNSSAYVIVSSIVVPNPIPPVVTPVGITVPTNMSEFVGSMYQCVLGRTASASEKESWASTFTTQKTPIMTMYKTFFGSAEYTLKNTSNSDYAKQVYTCVLFRTPAQSEIDFQANAIPSISRDGLLSNFLNSGEFENLKSQKMQFLSGFATK
jgi:hypothetical protein